MKRLLMFGAITLGLAAGARRLARHCGDFETMIERMPEDAPPKWMFRNISAIRKNTESILELLETEHTGAADHRTRTVA